jgi:hypothetical protein
MGKNYSAQGEQMQLPLRGFAGLRYNPREVLNERKEFATSRGMRGT